MSTSSAIGFSRDRASALGDVAAVLVLYDIAADPGAAVRGALDAVPRLVLVDNAPEGHPATSAWRADPRVTVLHNANRGGLAGAYNAATAWLRDHAPQTRHVVFIDDDSDTAVLATFLRDAEVQSLLARPDTAAVAPAHRDRATGMRAAHLCITRWSWQDLPREQRGAYRVSFVINSMSVWRMEALSLIGVHNEWLGVDHIDTEYCLRAFLMDLNVYLHADHEFAHSIGFRREYRLIGRRFQSGGHSAERRHNIGRANAWLACVYGTRVPAFAVLRLSMLVYEVLGIVLVEDDKARKVAALASGAVSGIASAMRRAI